MDGFDRSVDMRIVGLWVEGLQNRKPSRLGKSPQIMEDSTIKMCGDKRVMVSSDSFYSYRANVNF